MEGPFLALVKREVKVKGGFQEEVSSVLKDEWEWVQ